LKTLDKEQENFFSPERKIQNEKTTGQKDMLFKGSN
jgi:hypothetical protein